jgi:alkane 1-monooxygenase
MVAFQLVHAAILFAIYYFLGAKSLIYQGVYCFWGVIFLESGNYVQHYGLSRAKDENGVYESIKYKHSWNAASTLQLFRLQSHSYHHAHAFRPY